MKKKYDMVEAVRKHLEGLSEEEKEKLREEMCGPEIPKGWLSIEDHLPMMMADDLMRGGSTYKIRYADGSEGTTIVGDHNVWYYMAKDAGITHWLNEDRMSIQEHADFSKYYDNTQKRNIWVLGYFGGGSINIVDAYEVALEYAKTYQVAPGSVQIDEILSSRRYKGFKFVYSQDERTPDKDASKMDNVHEFLRQ